MAAVVGAGCLSGTSHAVHPTRLQNVPVYLATHRTTEISKCHLLEVEHRHIAHPLLVGGAAGKGKLKEAFCFTPEDTYSARLRGSLTSWKTFVAPAVDMDEAWATTRPDEHEVCTKTVLSVFALGVSA